MSLRGQLLFCEKYLLVFFKTEELFDVIRADDNSCQMEKEPQDVWIKM